MRPKSSKETAIFFLIDNAFQTIYMFTATSEAINLFIYPNPIHSR